MLKNINKAHKSLENNNNNNKNILPSYDKKTTKQYSPKFCATQKK